MDLFKWNHYSFDKNENFTILALFQFWDWELGVTGSELVSIHFCSIPGHPDGKLTTRTKKMTNSNIVSKMAFFPSRIWKLFISCFRNEQGKKRPCPRNMTISENPKYFQVFSSHNIGNPWCSIAVKFGFQSCIMVT